MLGQIGKSKLKTLATQPVGRLGDDPTTVACAVSRKTAGRLAILVAVDLPALRVATGDRDAA